MPPGLNTEKNLDNNYVHHVCVYILDHICMVNRFVW